MITARTVGGVRAPYRIPVYSTIIGNSGYMRTPGIIHDAPAAEAWESFNVRSLPGYFTDGVRSLHAQLDRLSNFSHRWNIEDDKNLWFMLESLLQARHLIDETRIRTVQSENAQEP